MLSSEAGKSAGANASQFHVYADLLLGEAHSEKSCVSGRFANVSVNCPSSSGRFREKHAREQGEKSNRREGNAKRINVKGDKGHHGRCYSVEMAFHKTGLRSDDLD
jgi:hypothetical protein